jgi:hypothetical protein
VSGKGSRSTPGLLVLVLLGLAGAVATALNDGAARFFGNWIVWFLFLATVGLGALFIVALEHVVGSVWSVPLRRCSERLAGLVVWIAPVAIVALFALPVLFPWTRPEAAAEPMVGGKLVWLNVPFVTVRLLVSLALWAACYWVLCVGSFRQDAHRRAEFTVKARRIAPAVLIVFGITLTNLAFDWVSSLEPLWYSDMFGVYLFAGTFVSGLAATILAVAYLSRRGRLPGVRFDHVYNLGAFLFAFIVFWSYIAFAQYMLQWYANMPEEVFWYEKRIEGIWGAGVLALAALHFAIPFLALLPRRAKGDLRWLSRIAVLVLVAHFVDLFWMVFPVLGLTPSWQELSFALLFVAFALLWVGREMGRGEDMPVGDPFLGQGLEFELGEE